MRKYILHYNTTQSGGGPQMGGKDFERVQRIQRIVDETIFLTHTRIETLQRFVSATQGEK